MVVLVVLSLSSFAKAQTSAVKLTARKKFFSQNLLPLCHQPPETTVFQTHAGGGNKVAGGSKAPTPTPPRKGGERLRAGGAAG